MKYIVVCVWLLLFMVGCEDSKQVEISEGNKTSLQTYQEIESMDKVSYAGLENVFLDTKTIAPHNKPMVFIFGKNNCAYCEKLKSDIKENKALQETLSQDFSAYYINIDYSKKHHIMFESDSKPIVIETSNLARQYNIRPTPTLIFSDSMGNAFFAYPGYMKPSQLQALLERLKSVGIVDENVAQTLSQELITLIDSTK